MRHKEELTRLYSAIIDAPDKNFYLELKKYTEFVKNVRKFKKYLKKLEKKSLEDSKEYVKISETLVKQFSDIKDEIKEKNFDDEEIKKLIKELEEFLSGKATSSCPLVESLFYHLQDIIQKVKKYDSESYENLDKKLRDFIKDYYSIKEKFEHKKRVAEWHSFYFINGINILDEDLTKLDISMSSINKKLSKDHLQKIIDGHKDLTKEERGKDTYHLKKFNDYLLGEIGEKKNMKSKLIWIPFIIVLPLLLSIIIYTPFSEYDIEDNLIKTIGFDVGTNTYLLQIGNLNESVIQDELTTNFIESFTRTKLSFERYDLHFYDKSYIDIPSRAILNYNLSINNQKFQISYREDKIIKKEIKLNEIYNMTLTPMITFISDSSKNIESFEFEPSFGFSLKKSPYEFLLKFVCFYLVWITLVIIPIHFIIINLFKKTGQ